MDGCPRQNPPYRSATGEPCTCRAFPFCGSIAGDVWGIRFERRYAAAVTTSAAPAPTPKNMIWVGGGEFLMGPHDFHPEEPPPHRVAVDGFWMDDHPVTVAEFRRFVKDTGHVPWAEL